MLTVPLEIAANESNLMSSLSQEDLEHIASSLYADIQSDISSRSMWEDNYDRWMEMAEQVAEHKSHPWPNASNVKFPALAKASIQFNARAFPALFGNRAVFKGKILGNPTEDKLARSLRVGTFMSVQAYDLIPNWTEDNDRLLMLLPIVGTVFKKVWFNPIKNTVVSELVEARNLVVNYNARDFETARKTHIMYMTHNTVISNMNLGLFDADVEFPSKEERVEGARDEIQDLTPSGNSDDADAPYEIYECHCFLDLDGDGYNEPYIVTMFAENQEILRIVSRWDADFGLQKVDDRLIHIIPEEYFTCYKFLPDPSSNIYGIGFGTLIGPTGEAIDTAINQLIDAGTQSVLQSGFLGRGTRVNKGGIVRFSPGEWKTVQTTGDDLRKSILPLPSTEPSRVLFELLGLLIESTKDITSLQDMMMGKSPGQNQPYSTSREVLEQGLKVFNGIYKRVYRSLTKEAELIFNVNRQYLSQNIYTDILAIAGTQVNVAQDFNPFLLSVVPSAEPDMVNEVDRIMKAEGLVAKLAAGMPLSVGEVTRRVLEAENHEGIEALMDVKPKPNPELILKERELNHKISYDMAKLEIDAMLARDKGLRDRASAIAQIKKIEIEAGKADLDGTIALLDKINEERELNLKEMELAIKKIEANKPKPKSDG